MLTGETAPVPRPPFPFPLSPFPFPLSPFPFTFYVLRFTFYVLRFTFYALRFTFYVLRLPKLDVSDVFLKDGSTIRRLAFLHRVDWGSLPRFHRYYQGAPTSCRSSRVASLPSLGGTMQAHDYFRFSQCRRVPNIGSGVLEIAFPVRYALTWKRQDLSSCQGTSIVCAHMFPDPGRSRRRLPITRRSHAPRSQHDGDTHD
jgi:hypothetical protein